MSAEKKVSLLILLLIALISTCVYTHVEKIENNLKKEPIENQTEQVTQNVETQVVEQEKVQEVKEQTQEEPSKVEDETSTKEEILPVKEELNSNQEQLTNQEVPKKSVALVEEEKKSEVIEEKVAEPLEESPLITTGKKYRRVGTDKRIEELSKDAQLLQIRINEYVKNNPIVFKRASYDITKKSIGTIETIVSILQEYPNIKIEVAGHTDAAGPDELNKKISVGRAITIKERLIKLGIEKDRIKARGYGENIPLVKNSPKGYSRINRRVEFNIIGE